jgi:hypothetical protein
LLHTERHQPRLAGVAELDGHRGVADPLGISTLNGYRIDIEPITPVADVARRPRLRSAASRRVQVPPAGGSDSREDCSMNPTVQVDAARLDIADEDLDALRAAFGGIPTDPYVENGTRSKAIIRGHVDARCSTFTPSPHGPIYQPPDINSVQGGKVRHYPELTTAQIEAVAPLILGFARANGIGPDDELLVQLQRIRATAGDDGRTGKPAEEGLHRDGVNRLAMVVVHRHNIVGGATVLTRRMSFESIVRAAELQDGQGFTFDDTSLFHYTSEIVAEDPSEPAFRDVVLLTTPTSRVPEGVS